MKANNLKSLIHESIENINDADFLKAIKDILDRKYSTSSQPKLTKFQVARINESKNQIKSGNFLTNDEADKLVESWLKK